MFPLTQSESLNILKFIWSCGTSCSFFLTCFWWKLGYYKIWYLIYNTNLILIIFHAKWAWTTEEVGTSLLNVKSREMQIFEEENDPNRQQKFNTSTCNICNKNATGKYISCSECHIQIHYRCTFLPLYQLYNFVEKKRKYTCINCTPTGFVDLSSDRVDVLINDIKEHLVKIEK